MLGLFWITIPFIKYSKNRSALSVMKKHEDPDADNAREPNSTNYYDVSLFGGRHTISLASAFYAFMTAPQIKFCYFTVKELVALACDLHARLHTPFSLYSTLHFCGPFCLVSALPSRIHFPCVNHNHFRFTCCTLCTELTHYLGVRLHQIN